MLDFVFYCACGACLVVTIYLSKIPFVSFTGIYLRLVAIVIYLPAYYVYRGGMLYSDGSKISLLAYVLLFAQIAMSCVSAQLAWRTRMTVFLEFQPKQSSRCFTLLLAAVIAYTCLYIYRFWDKIPLLEILRGDFAATVASRSDLTHGFSGENDRFFAYYRPITKDLLFMLIFALIVKYRKNRRVAGALSVIVSCVLLIHLEKSYALMVILALWASRALFKRPKVRDEIYLAIGGLVVATVAIYGFFAATVSDAIAYIPLRLMAQSGYVQEQLNISQGYGPLWLRGMNLGMLNKAVGIDFVDISSMAWDEIHASDSALGISGSSAGLASTDAYMVFGSGGLVVLLAVLYVHFLADKVLRTAIVRQGVESRASHTAIAFYIYVLSFYPLGLVGSFLGVFCLPYIVQPGLLLCCIAIVSTNRVSAVWLRSGNAMMANLRGANAK